MKSMAFPYSSSASPLGLSFPLHAPKKVAGRAFTGIFGITPWLSAHQFLPLPSHACQNWISLQTGNHV